LNNRKKDESSQLIPRKFFTANRKLLIVDDGRVIFTAGACR